MAIIPSTQYPGKTAGNTADYPYGEPRNITTPGDGTGTPWEAALVKDFFGLLQSLLVEADIVPSGQPDAVGDSQYLAAIKEIIKDAIAAAVPRQVRAWVRFGYVSGAVQIFASSGVSRVSRISQGKYRITFTTPIGSTAYNATGSAQQLSLTNQEFACVLVPMAYNSAYVDVWIGDNSEDAFFDSSNVNVTVCK